MAKKSQRNTRSTSAAMMDEDYSEMPETSARTSSRRGASTRSSGRSTQSSMAQKDYKTMIRELAANPAVRYVAGGIATAVLTRVATNLSQRYPEISRFISENLDGIEERLGDFKNGLNNEAMDQQH